MSSTIDLAEAAGILHSHFGPRFAASRWGGRHRLMAALRAEFVIEESDADKILDALDRRQAIHWEAERGLGGPCPGILELCGDWLIRPECL